MDPAAKFVYKELCAKYQTTKRKKMIDFFKEKSKITDFRDSKSYWKFYSSSITLKSDKSTEPIVLKNDNKLITDHQEIANSFNYFFTSLNSNSLVDSKDCLAQIDKDFTGLKTSALLKTSKFTFTCTTEVIVKKLLMKLSNDSSPGLSGIPVKVMKHSEVLVKPFTKMINNCIITKTIPDEWKSAVVTPLYKSKGEKSDVNNYRGISIISPIAKIFEKVLATQIIDYLTKYDILCDDQHGFRNSHSCETVLHELLTDLNDARNNKLVSLLLFIDFRKAFDLVDSNLLLRKLHHYGFDTHACDLIRNYFLNRSQIVKYENAFSDKKSTDLGTPQGSILGPLFFTLFINDLPFKIRNLRKKLFADDTTLYISNRDVNVLINEFKKAILPLLEWCTFNRMDINWSKTFFMFIKNKKFSYPNEIIINDCNVQVVDSFKLLGVTLDAKLNFSLFVSSTKKLVNAKLYSIKRLFYLSFNVKIQFFKTFIMPYFNYCITLSIYFPKATLQSLCNFYYFCLYKLFNLKTVCDITLLNNILESMSLSSFQHNLLFKLTIFSHNIFNNKNVPAKLKKLLLNKKNEDYNLRRNSQLFQPTIPLNHFGELTFDYFFPKFVNLICIEDIYQKKSFFETRINKNINLIFIKFIEKFPKFILYIKNFDFMDNYYFLLSVLYILFLLIFFLYT